MVVYALSITWYLTRSPVFCLFHISLIPLFVQTPDFVCKHHFLCKVPISQVLQLELGFCSSQSPFVMIRLSNGLMVTPKERPGKGLSVCDRLLPDQGPDQA